MSFTQTRRVFDTDTMTVTPVDQGQEAHRHARPAAAGAPTNGLNLRSISHHFGATQVLHDVSVAVAPGELVCLLGPSGCGKTTLLRLAAGLEPIQQGQVEIDETVVADGDAGRPLPPEKRDVGLMFQDFALFPHMDVWRNIGFGVPSTKRAAREPWMTSALRTMHLEAHTHAYPHTLSGGQQQRVALLRALAPEPKVLLLDEPFSGLDVTMRAQIRAETLQVVKSTGVATLMVTHDPEEAMFMADRILVMNKGRIVQDGAPIDLYFKPADAFVTELFGQVNRVSTRIENGAAETPFGRLPAAEHADGTAVQVLIRPEAIDLKAAADGDGVEVNVTAARALGRSSVVLFTLPDGEQMQARIEGVFLPDAGSRVRATLKREQSHIFVDTGAAD